MGLIHFHAAAPLKDRNGITQKQAKPEAKPSKLATPTSAAEYEDEDMREAVHADPCLMALDSPLGSDKKAFDGDPAKWVKAVMRREEIADAIREAVDGDGWVEMDDGDRDLLMDRLAECALHMTNANLGPVLRALKRATKHKPESTAVASTKSTNGHARPEAADAHA